jgi:hypothetical protein
MRRPLGPAHLSSWRGLRSVSHRTAHRRCGVAVDAGEHGCPYSSGRLSLSGSYGPLWWVACAVAGTDYAESVRRPPPNLHRGDLYKQAADTVLLTEQTERPAELKFGSPAGAVVLRWSSLGPELRPLDSAATDIGIGILHS